VLAFATHSAGAGTRDWIGLSDFPRLWAQIIRHFAPATMTEGLTIALARTGDDVAVTVDYLDEVGVPVTGRALTATVRTAGDDTGQTLSLSEVDAGRYRGIIASPATGLVEVVVGIDGVTGAASMLVPYPTRFDFSRADMDGIVLLAEGTGGRVLASTAAIFASPTGWIAVPGWWLWTLVALAIFLVGLLVRNTPRLMPRRRQAA